MFASLALVNLAVAGPFAATTLSPNHSTVNVGSSTSVDLNFAVGSYGAYGIDAWLAFDPTLLQVTSITNGTASPFTNVTLNTYDNLNGLIRYTATGSAVSNFSLTAASIVFSAVGVGTSAIDIQNVNELITGYGPYGVNGLAVDGSITVEASASSNVPDAGQTLLLLGSALVPLALLRRRFNCA